MSHNRTADGGRLPLRLLQGESMAADDAAWSMIAEAAERALTPPDLSSDGSCRLERLRESCLRAAGQFHGQPPREPRRSPLTEVAS